MIADTAALESLAGAWLDGRVDAGPPLHDLLEEAGWPWDGCTLGFDGGSRALAGVVPPLGNRKWYWVVRPGNGPGFGHGWTSSRKAARAAAVAALKRALLAPVE